MKNISRWIVISVLVYGLILAGCDKRKDVERDDVSLEGLNSEEILGESSDYQNLRALMGNMTYKQLLTLLDGSLKKLNAQAAQDQTETTHDNYLALYNIFSNTRTMMLKDQAAHDLNAEEGDALAESSDLMLNTMLEVVRLAGGDDSEETADNHIGDVLDNVIHQVGPNVLTENIYPMLVYALAADDDILKGAVNGVTIGSFKNGYTDFEKVMLTMHDLLDTADTGKYAALHDDLEAMLKVARSEDGEIKDLTFTDMSDLLASLLDSLSTSDAEGDDATQTSTVDNQEVLDNVTAALDDLWTNDPQFRADLKIVLGEAGDLMAVENGGDTDFGRVLLTAQQLLAPGRRDDLRQFVTSALHGLAPSSDGETLEGLIERIAGTDTNQDDVLDAMNAYPEGIGSGLLTSVTRNMYNQDRSADATTVKTSGLRALMYMMQEANVVPHARVFGASWLDLGPVLGMMDSPDGGTVADVTTNMAEWTVGEVVTAMNDHPEKTAYEALDWVLYTKRYQMVLGSLPLMTFNGMVGMMTNSTVVSLMTNQIALLQIAPNLIGIIDPFPAFVELAGGQAPSGEGTDANAYKNRAGTAGQRHKLFGLFAPLMQYYWDPNGDGNPADQRVGDMVKMLVLMNEIDCDAAQNPYIDYSSAYVPLSSDGATFKKDDSGIFMRLIEGGDQRDGGMLYYALRSHDGASADGILLDKALDLIVRIVFALDSEKYVLSNGETTFNGLLHQLDIQQMDEEGINDIVTALFDGKDGNAPLVETAYKLLYNNHAALVALTKPAGALLQDLAEGQNAQTQTTNLEALIDDIKNLSPLLDLVATDDQDEESTLGDLIEYLTAKNDDGSDNPFMLNAKKIAYRILDIKNSTYNADGALAEDVLLTGADGLLAHLLGGTSWLDELKEYIGLDNGLYDFTPLFNFAVAVTGQPGIFKDLIEQQDADEEPGLLDKIMGNVDDADYKDVELSLLPFVRSLINPIDINADGVKEPAVLYDILGAVDLEGVEMQPVLGDVYTLLENMNESDPGEVNPLAPDGDTFKMLLKVLNFLVTNTTVK